MSIEFRDRTLTLEPREQRTCWQWAALHHRRSVKLADRARQGALRVALWLAIGFLLPSGVAAFHEQGVANCNGCHVTHTAEGGAAVQEGLLLAESPSDVCLLCHEASQGRVLGSDPLAPPAQLGAGNFVFLLEDDLNDTPGGGDGPIPGDAAGHNLVAPGHALGPDPRYALSPGGSFPSSQLGCTSCHDPHGNPNFRLLHGRGDVQNGVASFSQPAPEAIGVGLRSGAEGPRHHTAYRRGMSDWCANCHGRYHEQGLSRFEHVSDRELAATISQRYNDYAGDARPTDGVLANAYIPEVPFEDANTATGSSEGPETRSRVMCLTCHRAHASSAPASGRWDFNVAVLVDDGKLSGSYALPSPYPDLAQGSLCAKCHAGAPPTLPVVPSPGLFAEPTPWPTDPDG